MSPEQPSNKIGKSVGEKLRAARVAKHYTQSQLAIPDFSVSYISAIERGQIHPSLRALEILAARLGLTSTQLLPNRAQQDEHLTNTADAGERDEDEVEFQLLEAHILILQEDAETAKIELELLGKKRLKRQHQLQQGYLLGWAYYKVGQYQESEVTLLEAAQSAKDLGAHDLQMRILNLQAQASGAMRNYAQALQAHQRCLSLAEERDTPDPFFLMQIYIHIGQHYMRLDNREAALEAFHQALELAEVLTTPQQIQETYAGLCQYYAEEKNAEQVALYAYKSTHLHNQEMMKQLRSEIYYYLSQAMLQGDQQQARQYLDEVPQKPASQQDPLTQAAVAAANATWYLQQHELDQAASYAQQAQELARPFHDTIIAAHALILCGKIAYARQEYEAGNQDFTAGLQMLERLGSHEELADESVQYAELLEQAGQEREAFAYFRRAFQSRQRLGK